MFPEGTAIGLSTTKGVAVSTPMVSPAGTVHGTCAHEAGPGTVVHLEDRARVLAIRSHRLATALLRDVLDTPLVARRHG